MHNPNTRINNKPLPLDSILIDAVTLINTFSILEGHKRQPFKIVSFANFIENLVLHENLYSWRSVNDIFESPSKPLSRFEEMINHYLPTNTVHLLNVDKEYNEKSTNMVKEICSTASLDNIITAVYKAYPDISKELILTDSLTMKDSDDATLYYNREISRIIYDKTHLDKLVGGNTASASWLRDSMYRAWWYLGLAMCHGMFYTPNDFRAMFISGLNQPQLQEPSANRTIENLEKVIETVEEENAKWLSVKQERVERNVIYPVIFSYIVAKAKSMSEILPIAFELRDKPDVRRFRSRCMELDELQRSGNIKKVRAFIAVMEKELKKIENSFSIDDKIQVTISYPPAISFSTQVITNWIQGRNLIFLRQLFRDATQQEVLHRIVENFPN